MFAALIVTVALTGSARPTPVPTPPGSHADCVRARSFAQRGIDEATRGRRLFALGKSAEAVALSQHATIDLVSSRNLGIEACDSSVHPRRLDVYRAVAVAGATIALGFSGSPAERAAALAQAIRMQTIVRGLYRPQTPAYRDLTRELTLLQHKYSEAAAQAEAEPRATRPAGTPVPLPSPSSTSSPGAVATPTP